MTLELELLVNAWDNYKKNLLEPRVRNQYIKNDNWFTPSEERVEMAIVKLIQDADKNVAVVPKAT